MTRRILATMQGFMAGALVGLIVGASLAGTDALLLRPGEVSAAASGTVSGTASFVGPRFGPRYLALPEGRGIRVEICSSAGRCVTRVSTDAGPDRAMQRAGRVADLSFDDFAFLCGCDPWVVGLMPVTVTRGAALPPPPDTATGAGPDFRGPAALLFLFWLLWFTTRQGDR
jgi:hypothetical protein